MMTGCADIRINLNIGNHERNIVTPSYSLYGNLYGYTDDAVRVFEEVYKYREISTSGWDTADEYVNFIKSIGQSIPEITLQDMDGNDVNLKDIGAEGKKLLQFSDLDCDYCDDQLENHDDLYPLAEEAGAEAYVIYPAITDPEKIKNYYTDMGKEYDSTKVLIGKEDTEVAELVGTMNLRGYPSFYLVDDTERISWTHYGVLSSHVFSTICPYAYGEEQRIYDMRNFPLTTEERNYEAVKQDIAIGARNKITLLSDATFFEQSVYDNIGRYFRIEEGGTDINGKEIKDLNDEIAILFLSTGDEYGENQDTVYVWNKFLKEHPAITGITVIIPLSAIPYYETLGLDEEETGEEVDSSKSYYDSLKTPPDGYVLDAGAEDFPPDYYHLIYLYTMPSVFFVNNDEHYISGAYMGEWTTTKLEEADEIFNGKKPAAKWLAEE